MLPYRVREQLRELLGDTASLRFAGWLMLAGLIVSYLWMALLLPAYNSEHITCDGIHHAILVYCHGRLASPEREAVADLLATYPQLSHWLASWLMPVLAHDPFKALRCFALASVFAFLALQYHLLRRFLPALPAALALLWWQAVCHETRTCNAYIYLDTFFFSQAIGTLFLWLAIVLLTRTEERPRRQWAFALLGTGCAALAYLCHIVPGVVALGGVGLFLLLRLLRQPNRGDLLLLTIAIALGAGVVFGTPQLHHMQEVRVADGDMPLRQFWLLVLWVPTLLGALGLGWWHWKRLDLRSERTALAVLMVCLLLAGGLLQAYVAAEWLIWQKAAAYSVKKFFYLLFPLTALLWFLAGITWLPRWSVAKWLEPLFCMDQGPRARSWPRLALKCTFVLALLYLNYSYLIRYQFRGPYASPERNPVQVAEQLRRELPPFRADAPATSRSDRLYYDPRFPRSSVYVNVVGLRRGFAEFYNLHDLQQAHPGDPELVLSEMGKRRFPARELLGPGIGRLAAR